MRIVQILNNKAHWIFSPLEIFGKDEIPELPPDVEGNPVELIDITDKVGIMEGWDYNRITGEFTEPININDEPEFIPLIMPTDGELAIMEALAAQYEEGVEKDLVNMEVQATIFEKLLEIEERGNI